MLFSVRNPAIPSASGAGAGQPSHGLRPQGNPLIPLPFAAAAAAAGRRARPSGRRAQANGEDRYFHKGQSKLAWAWVNDCHAWFGLRPRRRPGRPPPLALSSSWLVDVP